MDVKINFRMLTKNNAANSKIKSGTPWELMTFITDTIEAEKFPIQPCFGWLKNKFQAYLYVEPLL